VSCRAERGWWTQPELGVQASLRFTADNRVMHTTPLWVERDEDLRKAIHAVDPEELTTVFSAAPAAPLMSHPERTPEQTLEQTAVLPPVLGRDARRTLILAAVGAIAGLGLLALLVAFVVNASNSSTTIVRPPVTPVTKTPTAQVITPSWLPAPAPAQAVGTPPPTAVVSAERMAPAAPAPAPADQQPIRERLHEMFPRLFP